jgi:hypothetical protein
MQAKGSIPSGQLLSEQTLPQAPSSQINGPSNAINSWIDIGGIEAVYNVTALSLFETSTIRTVLVGLTVRITHARRQGGGWLANEAPGSVVKEVSLSTTSTSTRRLDSQNHWHTMAVVMVEGW